MNNEKIFITGLGIISALGNSIDETSTSLSNDQINSGKIEIFDCIINKPVFKALVPNQIPSSKMRTKELADIAFNQAIVQAKIADPNEFKIGICCGTTVASQLNDIEFYKKFRSGVLDSNDKAYDPVKHYLAGNISESLLLEHKFTGPGFNVVNACSSGTDAIGIAISWIKKGLCDIVIAGGADELNRVPIAGFNSLGILSDSLCKPFDKNRDGLNLGEGAAFLVLEKESSARKRDTELLAECCSYSTAADAYHLTTPEPDGQGLKIAINKALSNANLKPNNINFINAHGTATKNNDMVEGHVFKDMFSKDTKVLSIKGHTGHTLGAAGAIDAVLTVLSIKKQWLPNNAGFSQEDPEIGFSPVTESTNFEAKYALSTSLAFGGVNSAVIFGRA
ncbi:MAG: beta-ketoacyl-[acyl-carrier-protein] synthase family protein [Desulfobacteraceae bacterium]|nr:beta-ketoacyl-[acyl-carrier-protein] synthase family protein [Desulfobacteraceae bacterium]